METKKRMERKRKDQGRQLGCCQSVVACHGQSFPWPRWLTSVKDVSNTKQGGERGQTARKRRRSPSCSCFFLVFSLSALFGLLPLQDCAQPSPLSVSQAPSMSCTLFEAGGPCFRSVSRSCSTRVGCRSIRDALRHSTTLQLSGESRRGQGAFEPSPRAQSLDHGLLIPRST